MFVRSHLPTESCRASVHLPPPRQACLSARLIANFCGLHKSSPTDGGKGTIRSCITSTTLHISIGTARNPANPLKNETPQSSTEGGRGEIRGGPGVNRHETKQIQRLVRSPACPIHPFPSKTANGCPCTRSLTPSNDKRARQQSRYLLTTCSMTMYRLNYSIQISQAGV